MPANVNTGHALKIELKFLASCIEIGAFVLQGEL